MNERIRFDVLTVNVNEVKIRVKFKIGEDEDHPEYGRVSLGGIYHLKDNTSVKESAEFFRHIADEIEKHDSEIKKGKYDAEN